MKKEFIFALLSIGDVSVTLFHHREATIAVSLITLFVLFILYIKKIYKQKEKEKEDEIFQLNQKWEDFFQKYKAQHEK